MFSRMDSLASPENVSKICEYVVNVLEKKQDMKDEFPIYLKCLKYICYGTPEERAYLSSLTPEEKLVSILETTDFKDFFKIHPDVCINAAEDLLSHCYLTVEICKALKILISSALLANMNKKSLIIISRKLFDHEDFTMIPVELIEEVIALDSTRLELHVIELYFEKLKNSNAQGWSSENSKHWVTWCSRSSTLFCKLSSIMNQILLSVKNIQVMLMIINDFVGNVLNFCARNGFDFIGLYPIKLQPLISVMSLNTEGLPVQCRYNLSNYVSENINILRKEYLLEALILWTHFDKWKSSLSNFN